MRDSPLVWKLFWTYVAVNLPVALLLLVLPLVPGLGARGRVALGAACAASAALLTGWLFRHALHPLGRLVRRTSQLMPQASPPRKASHPGDEISVLDAIHDLLHCREVEMDQLRQQNERLTTVLASMNEGVIAVDRRECILVANEASRRLLNFATSEIAGRPLLEVARSRPLHEAVLDTLRSNQTTGRELAAPGQPERILSLQATCLPGQPCPGTVVVLHDVSELRRLENLRHEFVANVSHELKTPLAAIKAYAETLRLGAVNDQQNNVQFVTQIEEQADRLHQLIVDMLQIARVETGREVFDIGDVPVAGVVEGCANQYASKAHLKRIDLRVEPPQQPVHVRADQDGLRTIVENLVDNAIKYTPDQGAVTVRWWPENGSVILEVHDTGIGIGEADQRRVFERFFRVDKARSREMGGTGLGLAIVKHLSQAFGGSVTLRSQVGAGARFRVRLPAAGRRARGPWTQ